jgi:hypothetical protein
MGLLDEAIRDHLELKRRSGADPGEIAREEREALEPVFPDEPRPEAFEEDEPLADDPGEIALEQPVPSAVPIVPGGLSDETAELDMDAVLGDDHEARVAAEAAVESPPVEVTVEDELFEWEATERQVEPPPEPIPGQERLSFE